MPSEMEFERRRGIRYLVSMPIRVAWKSEDGSQIVEDGMTENVGPSGVLIHLTQKLPPVGGRVDLQVMEDEVKDIVVPAEVLRLVRNAAHQQVAFYLVDSMDVWQERIWDGTARRIFEELEPEEFDDF